MSPECTGKCPGYEPHPITTKAFTYAAAAGEVNALTATPGTDKWTFTDPGATVEAGEGCTSVDAHTVSCIAPTSIKVGLGDQDDSFDGSRVPGGVDANGGEGHDKLRGGAGGDTLNGAAGRDELIGGPGDDTLIPEDATSLAEDVVDGGPGNDLVSYEGRTTPVTVDLRSTATPGKGDRITAVESAVGGLGNDLLFAPDIPSGGPDVDDTYLAGGPGNDRLVGSTANDVESGGPGDDVLQGAAGEDFLEGDEGNDRLSGGAGKDFVRGGAGADRVGGGGGADEIEATVDGKSEHVACGAGYDSIEGEPGSSGTDSIGTGSTPGKLPDSSDVLGRDCESIDLETADVEIRPRSASRRAIVFRSPCADGAQRFRVRITAGRRVIGAASVKKCKRRQKTVRVPVRGLRKGQVVSVSWSGSDFDPFDGSYRYIFF